MKTFAKILSALVIVVTMASCSVSAPYLVTSDNSGTKVGEASYDVWLGFIKPMDADVSIKTAAKNGGITKVATVDWKVYSGLFKATYTTIVTGE